MSDDLEKRGWAMQNEKGSGKSVALLLGELTLPTPGRVEASVAVAGV